MTQPGPNLSRAWRMTFWHVYDNLGLLLLANILWLFFLIIPLFFPITLLLFPTATASLFYISHLIVADKPVKLKCFFSYMIKHFVKNTVLIFMLCTIYFFLIFNIKFYLHHFGVLGVILGGISAWLLILLLMALVYTFPLLCKYNNLWKILKYSFILTLDNFKTTFILFITTLILLCLEIAMPIIVMSVLAIFIQNAFLEIESRYNTDLIIKESRRSFREIWKMWDFS